jgi:hypothetical protein
MPPLTLEPLELNRREPAIRHSCRSYDRDPLNCSSRRVGSEVCIYRAPVSASGWYVTEKGFCFAESQKGLRVTESARWSTLLGSWLRDCAGLNATELIDTVQQLRAVDVHTVEGLTKLSGSGQHEYGVHLFASIAAYIKIEAGLLAQCHSEENKMVPPSWLHENIRAGASRGEAAVSGLELSYSQPSCMLWVDRHIHKNGGTSVRYMALELERQQLLSSLTGGEKFSPKVAQFAALATLLTYYAHYNCSLLRGVSLFIEAHEHQESFTSRVLPILRRLRRLVAPCCKLLLTTRVREPLAFYISAWEWGGAPLYRQWNHSLMQWAPHNAQSHLLLRGQGTWLYTARLDARHEGYWDAPDEEQAGRRALNTSHFFIDASSFERLRG